VATAVLACPVSRKVLCSLIDAQTDEVRTNGQLFTCHPARLLPMAQRYFLFCRRTFERPAAVVTRIPCVTRWQRPCRHVTRSECRPFKKESSTRSI
jgi:hypothetical protein